MNPFQTTPPGSPATTPAAARANAQAQLARSIPGLPRIHPHHPRKWTPLRITAFLIALDATGSVDAAARAAGMSRQSAYLLRERRPGFAALWQQAWRQGYGLGADVTQRDAGRGHADRGGDTG